MPKSSVQDIDYFDLTVEKLLIDLRNTLKVRGVEGLLIDDEDVLRMFLRCAVASGYDDGFIDRSGAKRVEKLNEAGQVIAVFRTLQLAAESEGVNPSSIQESIRNKGTKCRGHFWRFKKS